MRKKIDREVKEWIINLNSSLNVVVIPYWVNKNTPKEFIGLDRFEARTKITKILKTNYLITFPIVPF